MRLLLLILSCLLAIGGFVLIGWLLWRHRRDLALLDPASLKEEQQRQKREAILMRRFERLRAEAVLPWRRMVRVSGRGLTLLREQLQKRVATLEKAYDAVKNPETTTAGVEHIRTLLNEAKSLARDLKWSEAERRYVEVLSFDPRQPDAYRGLGAMYLKQRQYDQAQETFTFLLKIKQADDTTFAGLAEIALVRGEVQAALDYRRKAVTASPKQACRYAELAECCRDHNQLSEAKTAASRACELEPNSARYLELSLEIAILLRDRIGAENLYERLRLVAADDVRYRAWRDRIEAIMPL